MRRYYSISVQPNPQNHSLSQGSLRILANEASVYESMPDIRTHGTFRGNNQAVFRPTVPKEKDAAAAAQSAYEMDGLKSGGSNSDCKQTSFPAVSRTQSATAQPLYELDGQGSDNVYHRDLVPTVPPEAPQGVAVKPKSSVSAAETTEALYEMDDPEEERADIECLHNMSYSMIPQRNKGENSPDYLEPLYD